MGMTIHYRLQAKTRSPAKVQQLLGQLRQRALDLPFKEVGEIVELAGHACDPQQYDRDDPLRWLVTQAAQFVVHEEVHHSVRLEHLFAFYTWPGEGCEAANFGLGLYPKTVQVEDLSRRPPPIINLRTGIKNWSWSSFCKTQYASNPEDGGVAHFLRCHLSVIRLLDHAKDLRILESVSDEGGFWEKRDVKALAEEVGDWNQAIAGLAGELKDLLGEDVESQITNYPDFEHLEAKGRSRKKRPKKGQS